MQRNATISALNLKHSREGTGRAPLQTSPPTPTQKLMASPHELGLGDGYWPLISKYVYESAV